MFLVKIDEGKELGRGGYGTVFLGSYEGNQVAVKRIPAGILDDEKDLQREVKLHKKLDHENVLKLLHVDEEKDPKFKLIILFNCAVSEFKL